MVSGPQTPNLTDFGGPKGVDGPQNTHKMAQKRPKNASFPRTFFFAPKHSRRGPEWFGGPQNPIWTDFGVPRGVDGAKNTHKMAQKRPKNAIFGEIFVGPKTLREGSWVVPGPPKPKFDRIWGPKRGRWGQKYPQNGQNRTKVETGAWGWWCVDGRLAPIPLGVLLRAQHY